jgi:hypothetical protein
MPDMPVINARGALTADRSEIEAAKSSPLSGAR